MRFTATQIFLCRPAGEGPAAAQEGEDVHEQAERRDLPALGRRPVGDGAVDDRHHLVGDPVRDRVGQRRYDRPCEGEEEGAAARRARIAHRDR